jgi:hypothetical protein
MNGAHWLVHSKFFFSRDGPASDFEFPPFPTDDFYPKIMLFSSIVQYEAAYMPEESFKFFSSHWEIPIISVVLYLLMCYYGPKYMENRKPFALTMDLAAWNAFLALFSIVGAYITVPAMINRLWTESYYSTVCSSSVKTWASGQVGFWVMLFCASKIPELIDTVFIVLRKRPLIFLHWYHHVTVLLYCWDAFASSASTGLYFVAMNYFVHAIMYSYYFLQVVKCVPKWFPAYIITILQILQMVVGTVVCISSWYYYSNGKECHSTVANMVAGGAMYASYMMLFVQFALNRFVYKKRKVD